MRRWLVPIWSPFPVWHYQPTRWDADDMPDGFAWVPSRFVMRSFETRAAAVEFCARYGVTYDG